MIKTDCVNFEYEQDMGKSIPSCRITKRKTTACLCDTESNYIDDCGDCDGYVRKDYGFLKSVIKTLPEPYKEGGTDMRKPNCVTCDHFGKCEGCEKGEEE